MHEAEMTWQYHQP